LAEKKVENLFKRINNQVVLCYADICIPQFKLYS